MEAGEDLELPQALAIEMALVLERPSDHFRIFGLLWLPAQG
ncbi:hypothetical protein [Actinospica robiniae]|nr:hypothetical protein [Actinospica robiniae]